VLLVLLVVLLGLWQQNYRGWVFKKFATDINFER
jgi:hypothetical protein